MEGQVTTRVVPAAVSLAGHPSRLLALLRTPLYTNALYLWVNAAGAAVAGFAFWALVARLYNADDVGLGSAAFSGLTLLAILSNMGLGLGLIRFLAESGARGPRLANAVFTSSVAAAVVLSTAYIVGIPLWAPSLSFLREQPLYALMFIAFVGLATLSGVQAHAFVAIRKAKYILIQVGLMQLSRLLLPVLMAVFFGAFGIVASVGVAAAVGTVIGFALLARGLPDYRPQVVVEPASVLKIFPFSVANYVADSLLLVPSLVFPLVVVGLLGSAEGAYFYMAWFLGYLLTSASASLSLSLFAEGSHDRRSLGILSRRAVVGGLAVASMGALFLVLLGDKVLLIFGTEYAAEGTALMRIVALAALPAAVVNVYIGALRVTKRTGELVIISGVAAVATLALGSALLPVMGLAGAGVGHGLGQGLALAMVLVGLLRGAEGTMPQRMRWLLVTLAGRS